MKRRKNQRGKKVEKNQDLDRRSEIYRKALDIFIKRGYHGTSMSMISEALRMSKPNLYHYCSSKEDLFYQIHVDYLEKHYVPIIEAAERLPGPKDRIDLFLRKLTLLHTSNKAGRVLLHDINSLNKSHHNKITLTWRRAYKLIREAIKELQQSGKGRKFRESFLTFAGLGMANWTPYWFDYGRQVNAEELAETVVQTFLSGVLYPVDEKH